MILWKSTVEWMEAKTDDHMKIMREKLYDIRVWGLLDYRCESNNP